MSNPKSDPVLVVGGGLSGWLAAAAALSGGTSEVILAETLKQSGGRYSPEKRNGFTLGSGFVFPNTAAWQALTEKWGINLALQSITNGNSLVHSNRGWIAPESMPAWETYLASPVSSMPVGGLYGLLTALQAFCESTGRFQLALESPVTSLFIEQGKVARAALGGKKEIAVQEVIWTAPYRILLEALQGKDVPEPGAPRVSWLKKFVRSANQPAVVLEVAHSHSLSELTETLFLPFSAGEKEERRYLSGCFISNRDNSLAPAGKQLSSWLIPLTEAEWGDNHESMKKIRSAHRLLEKAFAGFETSKEFERVLVLEHSLWPLAKAKGDWQPLLENLSVKSDWAAPLGATPDGLIALYQNT